MGLQQDVNNSVDDPIDNTIIKVEDGEKDILNLINKPIVNKYHVEEWKKWFLVQKFSLDTVDMYSSFINRYVGNKVIVNQKTIDRFRENHMGTVSSSALKSFLKFLVYKKNFPENILNIRFEKNKQQRKEPKIVSPEEVDKIIEGMERLDHKLLTQTIYSLALRVEEAFKILWSDFDWSEWIKDKGSYGLVHLKNTKRNKFRTLPVNPILMSNLYKNHNNRTSEGLPIGNMVFGDKKRLLEIMEDKREGQNLNDKQLEDRNKKYYLNLEKQKYRDILYRISEKTIGKKISPHVLRHGKAQTLMDNETPIETIKEMLGHESISTTQIYARVSIKRLKDDMKKFDIVSKEINKEDII